MRDCTALRRVIIIKHLYRTLYLQSALGPFVLLFLTAALWGRLVLLNLFYLPAGRLSFKCFEINLEESKPFSVWKNKVGKKNPWWKFVLKKKSQREPVCWRRGSELIKGARIASIRLENNRGPDRSAIHGVGWVCGLSSSRCPRRLISGQQVQRFTRCTHREGECCASSYLVLMAPPVTVIDTLRKKTQRSYFGIPLCTQVLIVRRRKFKTYPEFSEDKISLCFLRWKWFSQLDEAVLPVTPALRRLRQEDCYQSNYIMHQASLSFFKKNLSNLYLHCKNEE